MTNPFSEEQLIIDHHAFNYDSSPKQITHEEVKKIIDSDCKCQECGKSVFDMRDFPVIKDGYVYCEDCELDLFYTSCSICENNYETPTGDEPVYIIISSETIEEYGFEVKPGFYLVVETPFFRSCLVRGFDGLYEDAIKLLHECDINSMLNRLGYGKDIEADYCCEECYKKYSGQTKFENKYLNQEAGEKRIALLNQVICDRK